MARQTRTAAHSRPAAESETDNAYGFLLKCCSASIDDKSDDWGQTYNQYYKAKFMKTDCTFNDDDKLVTVQPETIDQYNDVLAGLEKEYNLIELAPQIEFLFRAFWAARIGNKTQTPRLTKTH